MPSGLPGDVYAAIRPGRTGRSPACCALLLLSCLVLVAGWPQAARAQDAMVLRGGIANDEPDDEQAGRQARPDRTAPNYGRRRALPDKRLAYPGRRVRNPNGLPGLEPYATAPRSIRARPRGVNDALTPPNYALPRQIPRKRRPRREVDPYAPLGINLGSVRYLPFIELSVGYDTNPRRAASGGKSSWLSRIDAGFTAFSLWSRHEFRADVRAGYVRYFSASDASRPDGSAKFTLRIDVTRDTKLDFELRGTLTTQRPGSPELGANVTGRPKVFQYGATAGVTRTFGRIEGSVAILADRFTYENGRLSNGNIVPLSRDNYSSFGLRARVAYEATPGVKPFVEATVDQRQRDNPVDAAGFRRNSSGYALRAGSTFEISRLLKGEASLGYARRTYKDARLPTLAGPTFDAALVWTASPLTTVTLRGTTTLNETTVANAAGSVSRRGSIEISHALLRNLKLGATAVWQNNDYRGIALTENIYQGTLTAQYNLTRSVVVRGSFTHERLKSSTPGADYTANVFLLGLRLQR